MLNLYYMSHNLFCMQMSLLKSLCNCFVLLVNEDALLSLGLISKVHVLRMDKKALEQEETVNSSFQKEKTSPKG